MKSLCLQKGSYLVKKINLVGDLKEEGLRSKVSEVDYAVYVGAPVLFS